MGLEVTGAYRYPSPDETWLALYDEPVLDPDLPIVDAHHHLWLEAGVPYLLDELAADLVTGHKVTATVFVQAHHGYRDGGSEHLRSVGETEMVGAIRQEAKARGLATDIAAAIVAFADLTLGEQVNDVLDAHQAAAPDAFRGVRHGVSRDAHFPDGIVIRPAREGLLADPGYRAGLRTLARRGLTYDAMLYHGQIAELVDVAREIPDLSIILDHYGCLLGVGPYEGRREALLPSWRSDLAKLAECPNVTIKLGGLGMIVCGPTWHLQPLPPTSQQLADDWRPMFDTVVELFGATRCMFESNFPVDKAMYSYRVLWNAFKRLAERASDAERAAMVGGTARRVYSI